MRIIILGGKGQLGQALLAQAQNGPWHASGWHVEGWSRPAFDIATPHMAEQIAQAAPDLVINCAAWTQVDAAEESPDAAYGVNALGPKYVAEGCAACGASMVQISTNEVFAGENGVSYREYDLPRPGGVYARSKMAGEIAARERLQRLYVVRVAWLYGRGRDDFPAKIWGAAATRDMLRVVVDEFGNPTYAPHAADALYRLVQTGRYGTYHLVNEGVASRFEWAKLLFENMGRAIELEPIPGAEWPRPVSPPPHAVLVNQAAGHLGIRLPAWQEGLEEYVQSGVLNLNTA